MKWYLVRNTRGVANRFCHINPGLVQEYMANDGIPRPFDEDHVPHALGETVEIPEDLAQQLMRLIRTSSLTDEIADKVVARLKEREHIER